MNDSDLIARIGHLIEEERSLELHQTTDGFDDATLAQIRETEVALDQMWDLLRQRRARRTAGSDLPQPTLRDGQTVEGYTQ